MAASTDSNDGIQCLHTLRGTARRRRNRECISNQTPSPHRQPHHSRPPHKPGPSSQGAARQPQLESHSAAHRSIPYRPSPAAEPARDPQAGKPTSARTAAAGAARGRASVAGASRSAARTHWSSRTATRPLHATTCPGPMLVTACRTGKRAHGAATAFVSPGGTARAGHSQARGVHVPWPTVHLSGPAQAPGGLG
jgi:hypothetical protein